MNIDAFFKVSYGLYIVSSFDGLKLNGHISNTVFQVSANPARFAVASSKDNLTTDFIEKSNAFSISVISQDVDLEFLSPWGFKSGTEINKFSSIKYKTAKTGAPIPLENNIAWFDCEVKQRIDVGTHILYIGEVLESEVLDDTATPLTYDYYRNVIKGVSPKNAPTFLGKHEDDLVSELKVLDNQLYKCTVCGYIYDPEVGDPDSGIKAGTNFEDIPEDWECPVCGVTKKDFVAVDF